MVGERPAYSIVGRHGPASSIVPNRGIHSFDTRAKHDGALAWGLTLAPQRDLSQGHHQALSFFASNQLDGIAIRVRHEGNDGGARVHGPGLAHDVAAPLPDLLAGAIDIIDFEGQVAEAGT